MSHTFIEHKVMDGKYQTDIWLDEKTGKYKSVLTDVMCGKSYNSHEDIVSAIEAIHEEAKNHGK